MSKVDHFVEAHFYSGGLRHHAYTNAGIRPDWSPSADSVGFQNEFDLGEGDSAIEIRRFLSGQDRITWLGIYHRSLDTKLGDRSNHAGLGVWMQNCTPTDVQNLLYGLGSLSKRFAEQVDIEALNGPVEKFVGDRFLLTYLHPLAEFPTLDGIPFSSESMVDSDRYFARCDKGVGECRYLSDFILTKLLFGSGTKSRPRALFLVAKTASATPHDGKLEIVNKDFDGGAQLANAIPAIIEAANSNASVTLTQLEAVEGQLAQIDSENKHLKLELVKYDALKEDPLLAVMNRLDVISDRIEEISSSARSGYERPPIAPVRPPVIRQPRNAVVDSPEETTPNYVLIGFLLVILALLILIIWYAIGYFNR